MDDYIYLFYDPPFNYVFYVFRDSNPCSLLKQTQLSLLCLLTGKTALHWAASVNNLEVTKELLRNDAKKDALDEKVTQSLSSCFVEPNITGKFVEAILKTNVPTGGMICSEKAKN